MRGILMQPTAGTAGGNSVCFINGEMMVLLIRHPISKEIKSMAEIMMVFWDGGDRIDEITIKLRNGQRGNPFLFCDEL